VGFRLQPTCRDAALVSAEDEREVGMVAEAFFPKRLPTVAAGSVDFGPAHPPFGVVDVALGRLRLLNDPEVHVGGDDDAMPGMPSHQGVGPVEDVVGGVALEAEVEEVDSSRVEDLGAIGVVRRDMLVLALMGITGEIPGFVRKTGGGKVSLKQTG